MCCSRAFRFLALLMPSAFRSRQGVSFHAGYFVRFVANMMLRTVLRTDCSRFWLFLCVCVCSNAATSIAISMAYQVHMHSLHWKLSRSVKSNRVRCIFGYDVRVIENSSEVSSRTGSDVYMDILFDLLQTWCYERCFGQTAHVFGCFSVCVCVQMQQHLLPFPWLIRFTCTRFIETSAEVSSRTGSEEQGQKYIWICCSICCKYDATNGASDRLLTLLLAVTLCVFQCSNIHCHFHGLSGPHALASLKTQQKCQVEQGQMYIYI